MFNKFLLLFQRLMSPEVVTHILTYSTTNTHTKGTLKHTHTHKIYDTLTLSLINKIKYTMMYVAKIKRRGKIRKQNRKEEFAKWHHLLFTKINSKTLRRWKGYKIKEWWRRWEGGSGEESMLEYVQSLKCFFVLAQILF